MNNFWNNILRYPRFFISSLLGLTLIIITPFRNVFRLPNFRIITSLSIIALLSLIFMTIIKMTGL